MRNRLSRLVLLAMLMSMTPWEPVGATPPPPPRLLVTTERSVWSVAPSGHGHVEVGSLPWVSDADWGPAGRRILYAGMSCLPVCAAFGTPHQTELHVVDADGTRDRTLFTLPVSAIWTVDWSPNGRWIAYIAAHGYSPCWGCPPPHSLYLHDVARGVRVPLGPATDVEWSPDSKRIAIVHGGGISVADVAEGAVPSRITATELRAGSPSWSPNGKLLSFLRTDHPSRLNSPPHVWVVRPDGSGARRLKMSSSDPVTWSPDSRSVGAVDPSGRRLTLARVDGSARRSISLPDGWAWSASWSPDGSSIAYIHQAKGASWNAIRSVRPDGGDDRHLFSGASWIMAPIRWSPP
jgi:Tol biopolymer transport system component